MMMMILVQVQELVLIVEIVVVVPLHDELWPMKQKDHYLQPVVVEPQE